MEKYVNLAKSLDMISAIIISPREIFFDIRAILKCLWGCQYSLKENLKCHTRGTTLQDRIEMIKKYNHVLLVHSHNPNALSSAVLEIEKIAFLDGYHFAFAIRACNLCKVCNVHKGESCLFPDKIRPCDSMFGIDIYKTVRNLGLPCEVLQQRTDVQNRYGFVLID
jgi:predicted metal-binding protein